MSPEFYGYAGKILWVNLSKQEVKKLDLDEKLIRNYIGARGFGIKLLWDYLKPGTDPLSPESKFIITLGPLACTGVQAASRSFAAFKSPLTNTYFRCTAGGSACAEIKLAGYYVVLIEGKAEKPTYIYIDDDKVEFRDASHVWGLTTDLAVEYLRDETDRSAGVFVIGPAGERLVRFACIQTHDQRSFGRGGGGAVWGSKKLKAIVVKGSKRPKIYDEEKFRSLLKEELEIFKSHPFVRAFHGLGTAGVTYLFYTLGHFPTYNFKQLELPNVERFKPEVLEKYVIKRKGCYGCMIACWQYMKVDKGPFAGVAWDKPEYETLWSFGGNIGVTNVEGIIVANMLCDKYGIDTISAGSVIGFVYELYEKGILSKSELDGLEPRWGDIEPALELIRKIALREGIGNVLAEGVKRAAEIIGRGAEKFAFHVKGLEMPGYDPRAAKAHGLNLSTSNIGASHMIGWNYFEILGVPKKVDPFACEGKGELCKYVQDEAALLESVGLCQFPASNGLPPLELLAKLLYAATGIEEFKDTKYLFLVGERVYNLERAFNVREGFGREHDTMPERMTYEKVPRSPAAGQIFELERLLEDYYRARGWNIKTGKPTRKKLEELGLSEVADTIKAE
ncbi:MAG: aldehyde ferredoxin oxidoreductase family protein [Candidatus Nezhaarchaeales archaeon]